MTFYLGRFAEIYDAMYCEKPYALEAHFVLDLIENFSGSTPRRILEIACGTGTHAVEIAKCGVQVDASDCSADMLKVAFDKVRLANVPVRLSLLDMTNLPVPEQPYDAAICLFDSIGYVQSDEAICKVLEGIGNSITIGGLFILEYWHAPAMLKGFEPLRIRRLSLDNSTFFRVSTTTVDPNKSLAQVHYSLYELRANKRWVFHSETQTNRFFSISEMNKLAIQNKFEPVAEFDGFSKSPVCDSTWHVVAVWRRR